ncbi:MAG: hypothetical protein AAGA69_08555 [Pseudomonadota bacterium]
MLEQIMAWVQENPAIVTNGLAGAIIGPLLSKLLRGGLGTGTLGGLLGGLAGGFGADQAGLNEIVGNEGLMVYLQNILEGAVGGGVLGAGAGVATKRRD